MKHRNKMCNLHTRLGMRELRRTIHHSKPHVYHQSASMTTEPSPTPFSVTRAPTCNKMKLTVHLISETVIRL